MSQHLTQTVVNRTAFTKKGEPQRFIWDGNFGLRIGSQTKAFVAQTPGKGRVTLGRHPELLVKHARALAATYLEEHGAASGRRGNLELAMTLRQAIEHTISVRQPKTDEYRSSLHLHFKVWLDRPVRELTEDEVERVFEDLMLAGKRRTAVKVVTLLGTVLRTVRRRCALGDIVATQFLADEGRLPTFGRKSCSWETDEQFTAVIEAVRAYPNAHLVNMALLQCFTGMRLGETRRLRWDAINLKHRHLVVRETKSGTVLVLPLCPIHVDLLNEQQSLASNLKLDTVRAGQVFPALRRGTKVPFIQEVQELYHHVRKETGIHASSHDWRRWFISVGATLNDVPPDMRRRLTNHVNGEDAHQGYILGHAEQLRPAMVAITSKLVALADLTKHQ